jgi:threonine aldolase
MNTATKIRRHFASDNYAGICPEAWDALAEANQDHAVSYGDDPWTARAADLIRDLFETGCEVFFVFNGTAANSLALASSWPVVSQRAVPRARACRDRRMRRARILLERHEGPAGAGRGRQAGPTGIERLVRRRSDIHYPKPRAVSITQATEVGTVYGVGRDQGDLGQDQAISDSTLHMDGARFANAVASLGVGPKEITWQAGVDVLCFGGTKNGTHVGDAVVFFNRELAQEFEYRCKQSGQLCSKMRFLAAPWVGMLKDGAWLRHAATSQRHGASLARRAPRTTRSADPVPNPGQRRVCRSAAPRDPCLAPQGLEILHLHRCRWLPSHVRLGHARRMSTGLCRI